MRVEFSSKAAKAIGKMDAITKQRLCKAISGLPEGDVKPLQGFADGRQRLRVGRYRIIYKLMAENEEKILYIMDAGARGDIYK